MEDANAFLVTMAIDVFLRQTDAPTTSVRTEGRVNEQIMIINAHVLRALLVGLIISFLFLTLNKFRIIFEHLRCG